MNRKHLLAGAAFAAALATQPAHAQGWLKRLAGTAVETARSQLPPPEELAGEVVASASKPRARKKAAPEVEAEAPREKPLRSPAEIAPSDAQARQKRAFAEVAGDGFAPAQDGWQTRIGASAVGNAIEWSGTGADGALAVSGDAPVRGFACKQVHWMAMRRSDGRTAEREGLICRAKDDRWVEAY